MERKAVTPIFKFDKNELTMYINYELNLFRRAEKPLGYIYEILEKTGYSLTLTSLDDIDLNKVKQNKGKSYNWCVFIYNDIKFLVRQYHQHLTVYARQSKFDEKWEEDLIKNFAFTFESSVENLPDNEHDAKLDEYMVNPFVDLNKSFKQIVELIEKDKFHLIWNDLCVSRPDNVKIKSIYETSKYSEAQIQSIDLLVFCMEEIDTLHVQLFAENTMVEKLKELESRVGEQFDYQYKIESVNTEVKDEYYHNTGVTLVRRENEKTFADVYTLTRYYYDSVFPKATEK